MGTAPCPALAPTAVVLLASATQPLPCKDGRPMMPDGKPATDADAAPINHAQLHVSKSPYGPWENVPGPNGTDYIFEANNANPAPYILCVASSLLASLLPCPLRSCT